jgi:hypothetical protein
VSDCQQQIIRENIQYFHSRGRYLYQWYHYNHNAKRYENVIRGIVNWDTSGPFESGPNLYYFYHLILKNFSNDIIIYFEDFRSLILFPRYFSLFGMQISEIYVTNA